MRKILVLFTVAVLAAACAAGTPEPLPPGVYVRDGEAQVELRREIGPPAEPWPAISEAHPVIVVRLPDEDVSYLQFRGVWPASPVLPESAATLPPSELVSGFLLLDIVSVQGDVHEMRSRAPLAPGTYCLTLDTLFALPQDVSYWCFTVAVER